MPTQYGGGTSNERVVAFDSTAMMDYELRGDALAAVLSAPFSRGGVISGKGGELEVSATNPASFAVSVDSGVCIMPPEHLYAYAYVRDSASNYASFTAADPTNDRIDLVGVLFTTTGLEPEAKIAHITGTPAATPVAPAAAPQTATMDFRPLAEVTIRAGATTIAAGDVTAAANRTASTIAQEAASGSAVDLTHNTILPGQVFSNGQVIFDDAGLTRDATKMWLCLTGGSAVLREFDITPSGFVENDVALVTNAARYAPFCYVDSDRTYVGFLESTSSARRVWWWIREGSGSSPTVRSNNIAGLTRNIADVRAIAFQPGSELVTVVGGWAGSPLIDAIRFEVTSATSTEFLWRNDEVYERIGNTQPSARFAARSRNTGNILTCVNSTTAADAYTKFRERGEDGAEVTSIDSPRGVHRGEVYDFRNSLNTNTPSVLQIQSAGLARIQGRICMVFSPGTGTGYVPRFHVIPVADLAEWTAWPA